MKFKQVSLSVESVDSCEANDIKKDLDGLKDVLGSGTTVEEVSVAGVEDG